MPTKPFKRKDKPQGHSEDQTDLVDKNWYKILFSNTRLQFRLHVFTLDTFDIFNIVSFLQAIRAVLIPV